MRPRFNRELLMDDDGTVVMAKGPAEFAGNEHEAYIAVWITQDEVTGLGIAEKEKEFFAKAVQDAEGRMQALSKGAPTEDVDEAGPLWDAVVKTPHRPFKEGPAKAEGWLKLELPDGHMYQAWWTDEVELKKRGGTASPVQAGSSEEEAPTAS